MNKHVEKAKELRNATPMVHNCAQKNYGSLCR